MRAALAQQGGQISPDGKWLWNGVQWAPYQQPLTAVVPSARPYESARSRASFVTFGLAANAAAMVLVIIATVVVDLEPQKLSDSQLLAIAALSLIAFVALLAPTSLRSSSSVCENRRGSLS